MAYMTLDSAAKDYLSQVSQLGFLGGQRQELQNRIRTGQASRGLAYGDVAARQEAQTVGLLGQQKRLGAAQQLAQLTEQEALLPQQIEGLLAQTEASTYGAALPQLTEPVSSLSMLYGGATTGLSSIFNLSQFM